MQTGRVAGIAMPDKTEVRVLCPGCARLMVAVDRKPVLFSNGLVQVIFRCEGCGTETTRAVKD
jgi:hypothetical protein